MTNQRIGFIGLGAMGEPMATNLVKAGFDVTVFDLSPTPVEYLVAAGAKQANTAREVGEQSEVVITMLPKAQHVESALTGEDGLYAGLASGHTHIDMSTIEPSASQRFESMAIERGIRMFDAPVGKSTDAAASGSLTIMAGGSADLVDAHRDLLMIMGEVVHHCGSHVGAGAAVKVVNNLVSGGILVVVAEAMALGVKAGVSPEVMVGVLSGTGAANWQLSNTLAHKALKGDYDPGFTIALIHKDCGLGAQMSEELQVPMPVSELVKQCYADAMDKGYSSLDWGGYLKVAEEAVGQSIQFAS